MIRPEYILYNLPLAELLDDCKYILENDEDQLTCQTTMFRRATQEARKSQEYLDNWEIRLNELQTRNEFFWALINRISCLNMMTLMSSLEQAIEEATFRGDPGKYGFTVFFTEGQKPLTLIH